ncbi:MAG: DNA-3-methyladenine glycosylase 2 family protein [bacterium]|nr:DNA-3-methyladenine glycosylase 2 family protein [bacterium]
MALTRELMIDRMLDSDAAYDGRFITGVLSTGIYCLPSCPARKPRPENVCFFRRPEEAEAAGLRACKRCRPLNFYRGHDPDRALVEDLAGRLRESPEAFRNVADLVRYSGIGSSKLHELFRHHYHTTPLEMLSRYRIERARRELLGTDRPIADLAFDAGFETLSVFNDNFRRLQRMSPQSYRRLGLADGFEIELPSWFQSDRALRYLGRDPRSASERVDGRRVAFTTYARGEPVAVRVELKQREAHCRFEGPNVDQERDAPVVHGRLLRVLGLVSDPRPFERRASRDDVVARLIRGRRGLTIPQTPTVFDALVWVIAGQQVSLPVAFSMRRRLTRHAGARLGDGLHAPPTAAAVAALEERELHGLGFSRRKTEYLLGIARATARGSLEPERLAETSATRVERRLLAIRGLGPWSVNYLMMRSLALADCVPVGDAALTRNLKRFFGLDSRPDERQTQRLMEPFAPHRSLATFHFWSRKEETQ